jgi:branched-chain amino acid transport system substrate-binding protein
MRMSGVLVLGLLCTALLTMRVAAIGAPDPLEIHVIAGMTGASSFLSAGSVATLKTLQDSVNRSGGIHGRPIDFVVHDDTSNPQVAVQLASSLMTQPMVIDVATASECGAILPLIKTGPVHFCSSNGIHPPPGSFMFNAAMWSSAMIEADLRYFRERGFSRIGLLTATDATGQDAERSIDEALSAPENHTLKIVAREHFNPTDLSVDAQMARLKAASPDMLILWTTGTSFGTLLRGSQALGLSDLPTLTTAGNLTFVQMKQYASLLPAQLYFAGLPALAPEVVTDRQTKAAVADYQAAMKSANLPLDYSTAAMWDPGALIVAALRKLGPNVTSEQIRSYFASLRGYSGAMGFYDFQAFPQRGLDANNVIVVRWDAAKQRWDAVSRLGGAPLSKTSAKEPVRTIMETNL